MTLSESIVTTISPRARRNPSARAARFPRFFGNRIGVAASGYRAATRSICSQVSSVLPSSMTMTSSRSRGYSADMTETTDFPTMAPSL